MFRRTVAQSYRRIRVAIARINSYLQEHVTGIVVLQLFNREKKSRQEFERVNREHMDAFKDAITAYGWFYPVVEFLSACWRSPASWPTAASSVQRGGAHAWAWWWRSSNTACASSGRSRTSARSTTSCNPPWPPPSASSSCSTRRPRSCAPAAPQHVPAGPARIEFDHVWFAYKDEDWVLRDVSFHIEPGETIAVVGHTGAGKTTLISLLLRFYDVQTGQHPDRRRRHPRARSAASCGGSFGVVLQDPYLFTGTLEDNIRLGTDEHRARGSRRPRPSR